MPTINWSVVLVQDTAEYLFTNNPVLLDGQVGVETDTRLFKIGDGTAHWNDIAYSTINSQQSVWVGLSADVANLLKRSATDGGMTFDSSAFMTPTELTTTLSAVGAPVLNAMDALPVKAIVYRIAVFLRSVIEAMGTSYADLKTNTFAGSTVDQRFTALTSSVTTALAVISDATTAADKTWSSTKLNTEINARVSTAVANLVGAAPGALDTIYELAAKLTTDDGLLATIAADLANTIRFSTAQSLTDAQKLQARNNMGAVGTVDMGVYTDIGGKTLLTWLNDSYADTATAAVLTSAYI